MKSSYQSLSLQERQGIYMLQDRGLGIRKIAEFIGRSPSTVSRELNRCSQTKYWYRLPWYEKAKLAHQDAIDKKSKKRKRYIVLKNDVVHDYVFEKLELRWTPEEISFGIQKELLGESISPEAIYQFVYKHAPEYLKYLVRNGRTSRRGYQTNRAKALQLNFSKRHHSERTSGCLDRTEFGHLESDLIVSSKEGKTSLQVTIERISRKVWLKLITNREASTAKRSLLQVISNTELKNHGLSCTVDNGPEHSAYPELENIFIGSGFKIYYCDPHSPWQRGSVEAVNGILRRWFPKGTNFDLITEEEVRRVEDIYNNKPMGVLGYQNPNEVWGEQLTKAVAV